MDRYDQGYISGLRHKATIKIKRETVLLTLGLTEVDHAAIASSALFAAGYNDAVEENLRLNISNEPQ